MNASIRNSVRSRAGNRCEYCKLHQDNVQFARFHIEHIIPKKHGGNDDLANLALACHHCNLHKGSNLTGIDPESGNIVSLFSPRTQHWQDHFDLQEAAIIGLTPTGRVTVRVLEMNSTGRLQLRVELQTLGQL